MTQTNSQTTNLAPAQPLVLPLLQCIAQPSGAARCTGALVVANDGLQCTQCNATYRSVNGVPILNPALLTNQDAWFEKMYQGRDRDIDLASGYLGPEQQFLANFAKEKNLVGPSLEIGCGVCLFGDTVPQYIGIEYSLEALSAKGTERFARICGDAQCLPLKNASCQCVFSFNTLEHVPHPDLAFAEMDRVLQGGGYLVLKPAWHCARYVTELIHVLPASQLTARQKFIRLLLPVIRSKPYKFATRIPWRIQRRLRRRSNNPLAWTPLTPYHGQDWVADADATASLDSHEAILFYTSRGYTCLSHPTPRQQILAGHDIVVLQKPVAPPPAP